MPRVRHRLVICDPRRDAILLAHRGDRRELPEVVLEERHTADVEHLNAAAGDRFGLRTTVLLAIAHEETAEGPLRTHVLECHEGGSGPASAAEPVTWIGSDELAGSPLDASVVGLVREALARTASRGAAGDWTRAGWWTGARAWIEAQVGRCEVVQTRAWESSCVARVRALEPPAEFFFKALPAAGAREARVATYLSQLGAPGAPEVAAADLARRWILMRAFAGRSLDDVRDAASWERAAATYGRLQAATMTHISDLRALGCEERRLEDLAAAIEPLLADVGALMPGHPEGLTPGQIDRLGNRVGELRRCCEVLAAAPLQPALDHGDLWPSNILVSDSGCIVIDWEDACLQQPFLSLGPLLAMRREWGVDLDLDHLARAYLAPFAAVLGEDGLWQAFAASVPLALLDMAVRYWRVPAAVSDLHPWMREMVPFFLRHLLRS